MLGVGRFKYEGEWEGSYKAWVLKGESAFRSIKTTRRKRKKKEKEPLCSFGLRFFFCFRI